MCVAFVARSLIPQEPRYGFQDKVRATSKYIKKV